MKSREGSWVLTQILLLLVFVIVFVFVYKTQLFQPLPEVRQIPCKTCLGSGNENCLMCQGRGFHEKLDLSGGLGYGAQNTYKKRQIETCSACKGSGKKPCGPCWGKGTIPEVVKKP